MFTALCLIISYRNVSLTAKYNHVDFLKLESESAQSNPERLPAWVRIRGLTGSVQKKKEKDASNKNHAANQFIL